jgi:hypothetical protein
MTNDIAHIREALQLHELVAALEKENLDLRAQIAALHTANFVALANTLNTILSKYKSDS